ncbi:extracellular solute-binding protein [Lactococcus fujiensis]|uniref:extracellular solute-binding protein n=1 Tax=Lactococcus fujiensis TaxID=610251 RepID=UPI000A755439|nr:extracellular solute-binding protein [Lactococcus fujiensis]
MFASGKLPDIISTWDMTTQVSKTANKWALPLNQLATTYDPYWNKVASEDTMNWFKLSDGNTYGYPDYSNTEADYKSGAIKPQEAVVIREDVYKALGEPKMDTPEDFVKVMKQIKEKYPNLTALGFGAMTNPDANALDSTVQNLLGVPYYKDGKIYDRDMDKDYLTWLKALRQVHQDGGISDDSFTATDDKYKQNIQTGKYAAIILALPSIMEIHFKHGILLTKILPM